MGIYHGDSGDEEESTVYKSKGFYYLSTPADSLKCFKCKEVVNTPYTENEFLFCFECKSPKSELNQLYMDKVNDLDIYCQNWANGCSKSVKRKELKVHLTTCDFNPSKCPKSMFGCDYVGLKTDLATHKCTVPADTLVEKLMSVVFDQNKELQMIKTQLRVHDGHFLDFNDDVTTLKAAVDELEGKVERNSEFLKVVSSSFIIANKSISKLDLSLEDIDISHPQWYEDVCDIMTRVKFFQPLSIVIPLNSQLLNDLFITSLNALLDPQKPLNRISFVGDKSKTAISIPQSVVDALCSSRIEKIKFDGICNLYFENFINSILNQSSTIRIELSNCTVTIKHDRCKVN